MAVGRTNKPVSSTISHPLRGREDGRQKLKNNHPWKPCVPIATPTFPRTCLNNKHAKFESLVQLLHTHVLVP